MKYYKNKNNELFIDPIFKNNDGLIEITREEFDARYKLNIKDTTKVEITSISRLQAKLYLLDKRYYQQVIDLVEKDMRLKIYWNDAVNFNKDDTILRSVQVAIGLTDEQLDTMFLEASKL